MNTQHFIKLMVAVTVLFSVGAIAIGLAEDGEAPEAALAYRPLGVNKPFPVCKTAGVDIDAFELVWLEDPDVPGSITLALLFSVHEDDPLTPVTDESGGLVPYAIYYSFLTGSHALYMPQDNNVDALSYWSAPAPTNVRDTVNSRSPECVNSSAPFYADWVAFGSPDCWCYAQNCLGDADGAQQGDPKLGFKRVYTNDLTILATNWNIKEPPAGPGVGLTGICADFDRATQGDPKLGFKRVYTNDLTILASNWQIKEPPDGPGIGDCSGPDYNFFTTP